MPVDRVKIEIGSDDDTHTLVIGRRSGKRVVGGQIGARSDALAALREIVDAAIELHPTLAPRAYDPDGQLERREEYFVAARADVEDSMGILGLLDRGPSLDTLEMNDLERHPLLFFASVIGDDPDHRLAFVTRSNPGRLLRAGYLLTPAHGEFSRVESPVFVFEPHVDLIITKDRILIYDQPTFEQWFRDTEVMLERVADWVAGIATHLPLEGDGAVRLESRCRESVRLRRMLYAIQRRGHLKDVPIARIREHIVQQGLDPETLVRGDKLVFDEANPVVLLKVLNEDLFRGGLTDQPFVVDRKQARQR